MKIMKEMKDMKRERQPRARAVDLTAASGGHGD
jgi:hypothetical protein